MTKSGSLSCLVTQTTVRRMDSMDSNDNIPDDELVLAKLIQNVSARKLKACKYVPYTSKDGSTSFSFLYNNTVSCCAMGAAYLENDSDDDIAAYVFIARGNDNKQWSEAEPYSHPRDRDGESLGWAYYQAMKGR
jgi:hypothetical protein